MCTVSTRCYIAWGEESNPALRRRRFKVRILVAFEDDYRAYRGVLAAVIRALRPHTKVGTANLDELREEIERFDPQLVICTQPNTLDPGGVPAWVELSLDRHRPTKICLGGSYFERATLLGIEELLGILDDAERFVRTQNDRGGC